MADRRALMKAGRLRPVINAPQSLWVHWVKSVSTDTWDHICLQRCGFSLTKWWPAEMNWSKYIPISTLNHKTYVFKQKKKPEFFKGMKLNPAEVHSTTSLLSQGNFSWDVFTESSQNVWLCVLENVTPAEYPYRTIRPTLFQVCSGAAQEDRPPPPPPNFFFFSGRQEEEASDFLVKTQ